MYAPEAAEDLRQLYRYIAGHSAPERARGYVARIEAHRRSRAEFPEWGIRRDDLRLGLRIASFERRVSIAFHVTAETVVIDRVLFGGGDPERSLGAAFAVVHLQRGLGDGSPMSLGDARAKQYASETLSAIRL